GARGNQTRSIMKRFARGLTVLATCAACLAAARVATPQGKPGGRPPTYGGGPVNSSNAVKYSVGQLKAHNVPELTTDNKNPLVRKYPGKLLLSASSIWQGWPEALAFDDNPHSSWFTAKRDSVAHGTRPWIQVTFPEDVTVKRV